MNQNWQAVMVGAALMVVSFVLSVPMDVILAVDAFKVYMAGYVIAFAFLTVEYLRTAGTDEGNIRIEISSGKAYKTEA